MESVEILFEGQELGITFSMCILVVTASDQFIRMTYYLQVLHKQMTTTIKAISRSSKSTTKTMIPASAPAPTDDNFLTHM